VREPDLPRGFRVPGFPVTPILSIIACAYILSSLHWVTWVVFAAWVLVFLAFYMLYGRKHSVVGKLQRGEITSYEIPATEEH
jgi:basic amino acid/polyamine antiporter, APA family